MIEDIPDSWHRVPLADLVAINPGIDKSRFSSDEELPFVPMPAVEAKTGRIDTTERRPFCKVKSGFTAFATGDVLFAKITPCMENGKMAVVPELPKGVGFGTTEFHVLRPTKAVDARLLYYFVSSSSVRHEAQHNMTGAVGQKRVPKRFLETKEFPLPPLNEQHRIVEKIETLFARIDKGEEALREVQKLLKRYRQSILKAAVTGELTSDWREVNQHKLEPASDLLARILEVRRTNWQGRGKYKEPAIPNSEKLPELPETWCWASLEMIADSSPYSIVDGPFGSKLKTAHYRNSGVRVIRLENIGDGEFVDKESYISVPHAKELDRHSIYPGDLVIASLGQELPKACMIPSFMGSAIVKADCIRFSANADAMNSNFLLGWLNSSVLRNKVAAEIRGVGRPRLNLGTIRSMAVPLPGRIEQDEIASQISRSEAHVVALQELCQREFALSNALRQSILKSAFTGQLVPQEPNDEPASELLARIRAGREAAPKKHSKKKATRKKTRAKA